ncbi:hypothetical protein WB334_25025 [Escherichia coli]|uniref:hypothetical protein n=1 Tax=Escherichia coli TaxID=562 RepID=UPI0021578125|nr:hypothetical protein [Escherichia coli]MCR8526176.1 hypothetical protein [Escherichia coli]
MMGQQVGRTGPIHDVRFEEQIPASHVLRRADAILDPGFVHEPMAESYSTAGRPSAPN